MDKIIIKGDNPLRGSVKISGAKNAVLPVMAATLLAPGKFTIHKVPDLRDTRTMMKLLNIIGATTKYKSGTLIIDTSSANNPEAPYDLVKTMRASFYVLGPLISRFGRVNVSLPGGCAWGPRPVDYHLKGLEKLGANLNLEKGNILAEAESLFGTDIHFEFPSVGATGNLAMAAVKAKGITKLYNCAKEPEITQLCQFLNSMGAKIKGVGTETLIIEGVKELSAVDIEIIPDRIEAGTFLIAGALLGEVTVEDVLPEHLENVINKLRDTGCRLKSTKSSITIVSANDIKPVDMTTAVFPGFPTDLQAQWVALMCLANGSSVITDTVYHDRFSHIPELARFGANIKVENNSAFITGVKSFVAAPVMSTDIRASASLIIAALAAKGETEISRVYHIDRGYENIEQKFNSLGANIFRKRD
ncbi:MAG: UDP-N-acetylglucosamine 1-carboxyvinyltransferase [Flavobacteriaceae bacterium TMED184]|nr:MAG: UDP-N-acetylglucosamine 1-carboxyvinyltransferase [Flavobacteriaceae bacterium TMED184]|tara:strand:- start:34508 stop:35758 length:1251 start_codon:yes stop_codon:yes gene_type:complete